MITKDVLLFYLLDRENLEINSRTFNRQIPRGSTVYLYLMTKL